jgi:hypothetical protein
MSIADEEADILNRLGKIVDNEPDSPTAALADGIIMLNHKIELILMNVLTLLKKIQNPEG